MIGPKAPKVSAAEQRRAERAAYAAVAVRDEGRCIRCRRGDEITRDHRQGRGVGGTTTVENLQLLCGSGSTGCHGWKTLNPQEALLTGFTVPGYADPAEWPAVRWLPTNRGTVDLAWVLYEPLELGGSFREITEAEARRLMGVVS